MTRCAGGGDKVVIEELREGSRRHRHCQRASELGPIWSIERWTDLDHLIEIPIAEPRASKHSAQG